MKETKMMQHTFIFFAALMAVSCVRGNDIPRIREITEGPYQNYSAQPLVNLGTGYYYFENNLRANWYGALEFCRNVGLHVASVETAEENDLIVGYISANLGLQDFWLSGTDLSASDKFVWLSTGKSVVYTDWHAGEPSGDRNENCLHLWFKNGLLKWNDVDCLVTMGVVCENICDECHIQP